MHIRGVQNTLGRKERNEQGKAGKKEAKSEQVSEINGLAFVASITLSIYPPFYSWGIFWVGRKRT
ncbi:hypothetical protein K504DRAFT_466811 [Pleomassaria siparia CBS 279.74]|uniref:Uncharacterized protein n=1 Tax=Pleomassaria siparia CBS 279.74 TaxID=1314801 RepID=A0A6G1KC60_9PLEO|nr:hypothetical protein K504DRAFT_466811 [Pleomassaria siparia CBS 279.74]